MASQDKHCSPRLASIRSPQLPVGHSKYGVSSFHSRILFLDTIPTLKTSGRSAGRGAWMIPLFGRSALQLIENQFAMLVECAEALFERMEQ
jgi:hypothetical protein